MVTRIASFATLLLVACGGSTPSVAPPPAGGPAEPPAAAEPASDAGRDDAGAPKPSDATAAGAAPKPAEPEGTPRERLMRAHFKETALIRTAVIKGELSKAVAPAEALGTMDALGAVEASWKPTIDALKDAGRRIRQSPDIPGAAAATADIGLACASCHRTMGGPTIKVDAPVETDGSLSGRMKRHVWATERLWDALYAPSDASWKAGVDALSREPFPKAILDKGGVHARSAASRFSSIVATAGAKKTPADRAKVYASLLETCSACHSVTRAAE